MTESKPRGKNRGKREKGNRKCKEGEKEEKVLPPKKMRKRAEEKKSRDFVLVGQ